MQPWHMIGSAPRAFQSAASALAEALVVLRLNHMIMIHDSTKIKLWTWQTSEPAIKSNSSNKHQQTASAVCHSTSKSAALSALFDDGVDRGFQRSNFSVLALISSWRSDQGWARVCDRHHGDTKMFQRQISILYRINIKYDQSSNQYQNMAVDKILIKLKELDGICISEYGEK